MVNVTGPWLNSARGPFAMALMLGCGSPASDQTDTWTVTGHFTPGIGALSDSQATAFHGRTLTIHPDRVTTTTDTCPGALVIERTESAADIALSFRTTPEALGLTDSVRTLQVTCGGIGWTAFGARLFRLSDNRLLTPWDGTFFELTPQ